MLHDQRSFIRALKRAGLALTALAFAACAEAPEPEAVGDSSAQIEQAQLFLQSYGYLPSAALREREPNIAFVVDKPFAKGELDDATREALQLYQAQLGLATSGALDVATQQQMKAPRCGNVDAPVSEPDEPDEHANHEKFALGPKLTRGSMSLRVMRYPDGASTSTRSAIDADLGAASRELRNRVNLSILPTTSSSIPSGTWQVQVWFYAGARPSGVPAKCVDWTLPGKGGNLAALVSTPTSSGEQSGNTLLLCVNTGHAFMYGNEWDTSKWDFQSVALHELGHAAGVKHSSVEGAVMYPDIGKGVTNTSLSKDDLHALWARWSDMAEMQGSSRMLDLTYAKSAKELWAVLDNGSIWRRVESYRNQSGSISGTWTQMNGNATRIAHDGTRAWVVNSGGFVYWRNDQNTDWVQAPGCGRDVTGSAALGVWLIAGCDGAVYSLNGGTATSLGRPLSNATRVSLDPRRGLWVVDANNRVYMSDLKTPVPGAILKDIDVGKDGTVWGIGTNNVPRIFNTQNQLGTGDNAPPFKNEFVDYPGTAYGIAGNANGQPSIVNNFRTLSDIRLFYTN